MLFILLVFDQITLSKVGFCPNIDMIDSVAKDCALFFVKSTTLHNKVSCSSPTSMT